MTEHPKLHRLKMGALRALCFLRGGHRTVRQRWMKVDDPSDYTVHIGCVWCPHFKELAPPAQTGPSTYSGG